MRHCWNPLIRNDKRHSHLSNRRIVARVCETAMPRMWCARGEKLFSLDSGQTTPPIPNSHSRRCIVRALCVRKINFEYFPVGSRKVVNISLCHPICHNSAIIVSSAETTKTPHPAHDTPMVFERGNNLCISWLWSVAMEYAARKLKFTLMCAETILLGQWRVRFFKSSSKLSCNDFAKCSIDRWNWEMGSSSQRCIAGIVHQQPHHLSSPARNCANTLFTMRR